MPSKSKDQQKLMRAVKHNPEFAAKTGIPQRIGAEFVQADKARGKVSLPKRVAKGKA